MKRSLLLLPVLLACAQAAVAAPASDARDVGPVVDMMRDSFAKSCQTDRAPAAGASAHSRIPLDCTCGPQVLDAAFPSALRSTRMTQAGFQARLSGPMGVCIARTARDEFAAKCARGDDPFAHPGDKPSSDRAAAHCTCMKSALDTAAARDLGQAADASSASYAAALAASATAQPPNPIAFLRDAIDTCRAVQAPSR